jgi:cell division protein FtsX
MALIAAVLLALAAFISVRYLLAAYDSPDEFVVYFSQPVGAKQLAVLAKRLATIPGVASVASLDTNAALSRFKSDMRAHPSEFLNQLEGGGALSGALDVRTRRPWNLWATRKVVRAIEDDPAFHDVLGVPAPPGGWDTPAD